MTVCFSDKTVRNESSVSSIRFSRGFEKEIKSKTSINGTLESDSSRIVLSCLVSTIFYGV